MKNEVASVILRIDAVNRHHVEVKIKIQGVSKSLYESHRAAFGVLACAPALRRKEPKPVCTKIRWTSPTNRES